MLVSSVFGLRKSSLLPVVSVQAAHRDQASVTALSKDHIPAGPRASQVALHGQQVCAVRGGSPGLTAGVQPAAPESQLRCPKRHMLCLHASEIILSSHAAVQAPAEAALGISSDLTTAHLSGVRSGALRWS